MLRYSLTPGYLKIDTLPIKLKDLGKNQIDIEIIDNIKKSRNAITNVMYDTNYTVFKYMYNRLF